MRHKLRQQYLFLILFCFNSFSSFTQVYTPRGNLVSDTQVRLEELTAAQKLTLRQQYQQIYPRAQYIDEATTTYNCHAYAWHMSEGGSKVWMGMSTNPTSIYWIDGSYQTTSIDDKNATKVSYTNDNHSAIIDSPAGYVKSKWGAVCLFRHLAADCPYVSTDLKYYKWSMYIRGENKLLIPPTATSITSDYNIFNCPPGATVEWSISGDAEITKGQGSDKITINFKRNPRTCTIQAIVHIRTGLTDTLSLSVDANNWPTIFDIEVSKYMQPVGEYTLKVITLDPSAECTWISYDGSATYFEIPYPDDANFIQTPNLFKAVRFSREAVVTVQTRNSVGIDMFTKTLDLSGL